MIGTNKSQAERRIQAVNWEETLAYGHQRSKQHVTSCKHVTHYCPAVHIVPYFDGQEPGHHRHILLLLDAYCRQGTIAFLHSPTMHPRVIKNSTKRHHSIIAACCLLPCLTRRKTYTTQHTTPSQYEVNGRCRLVWLLGCPVGAAAVVMMVWFLVIEVRDDVHGEA